MPSSGAGPSQSSLFDQYAGGSSNHKPTGARRKPGGNRKGNATTRSAALRAAGVKVCCYLNAEVDRGRSTIVNLPPDCDSLAEAIPRIQQKMQLDKRMLFVAELFQPTGEAIRSYPKLLEAAKAHSPIIVGCGEPFAPSRIPNDLLEFHLNGGGRKGVKATTRELKDRRKQERHARADQVREAGHGVHAEAAQISRELEVEAKRENALDVRRRYMDGILQQTAEQQEESKQTREEYERDRRERIALERQQQAEEYEASKTDALEHARMMHDQVKAEAEARQQDRGGWLW